MSELARVEPGAAAPVRIIDRSAGNIPGWSVSIWDAFWRLDGDRRIVTDVEVVPATVPGAPPMFLPRLIEQRIPFTAIHAYALRYGIDGAAFDDFRRLLGVLDDELMEIRAEQRAGITGADDQESS